MTKSRPLFLTSCAMSWLVKSQRVNYLKNALSAYCHTFLPSWATYLPFATPACKHVASTYIHAAAEVTRGSSGNRVYPLTGNMHRAAKNAATLWRQRGGGGGMMCSALCDAVLRLHVESSGSKGGSGINWRIGTKVRRMPFLSPCCFCAQLLNRWSRYVHLHVFSRFSAQASFYLLPSWRSYARCVTLAEIVSLASIISWLLLKRIIGIWIIHVEGLFSLLTLSDPGGSFLPNPWVYCLPIVSGWAFENQYLMVFQVEGIYIGY